MSRRGQILPLVTEENHKGWELSPNSSSCSLITFYGGIPWLQEPKRYFPGQTQPVSFWSAFRLGSPQLLLEAKLALRHLPRAPQWLYSFEEHQCAVARLVQVRKPGEYLVQSCLWAQEVLQHSLFLPSHPRLWGKQMNHCSEFMCMSCCPSYLIKASPVCVVSISFTAVYRGCISD